MAKKMQFTPKRRLSSRDIMGSDVRKIWKDFIKTNPETERLELYQIGGIVNRFETVETDFGESVKLMGDFIGVNRKTGETFRSNRCYLPEIVSESITGAMAGAAAGTAIQFAFNIDAIGDDKSATGYVYTYESLMESGDSDLIRGVAEKLGLGNQLPAPEKRKELEDATKGKRK